jgi:hypothetical protein
MLYAVVKPDERQAERKTEDTIALLGDITKGILAHTREGCAR